MTISELIEKIGRRQLIERLAVVPSALSNAEKAERLPASWYPVVRDIAAEHDVDVPDSLFRFKGGAA